MFDDMNKEVLRLTERRYRQALEGLFCAWGSGFMLEPISIGEVVATARYHHCERMARETAALFSRE